MAAAMRLLVVIAALAAVGRSEERRFSTYKWAIKVPLDTAVNISCVLMANETMPLVDTTNLAVLAWHAPGGGEIFRNGDRIRVTGESDELLHITAVKEEDKGVYTCKFRTADGQTRYHKHGLNLNGQLYSSVIDQYKQNMIIGGSAAGAMLALVSFLCCVHTLVHKSKES